MRDSDIGLFSDMLSDIAALYGKTLSTTQIAMWFRLMAGFTVEQVQGAFDAHARDATTGRFMPLPADLLAKLETAAAIDGRPSPEEAWSTAIQAQDEAVTVVWTTETAQAWGDVGQALLDAGDRFNASRGFIAKYTELCAAARKRGQLVQWVVSQGTDKDLRHQALETAFKAGRISRETCRQMLPRHQDAGPIAAAIAGKVVPLLSGPKAATPDRVAEIQRASDRLAQLAEQLRQESPADHRPSAEQGKRIVMQAIESGVLTSVREIDEWMTRAAGREDVSELQVRVIEGRRHA
jgi:hypothetical protein